jgi:hypothetical protein
MSRIRMSVDEEKAAFNARAKASMQQFLRSKTWPEKIRSIERMNRVGSAAREAMKRARAGQHAG